MKKKITKILAVVLCVVMAIGLCGCSTQNVTENTEVGKEYFELISVDNDRPMFEDAIYIYREIRTDVLYVQKGSHQMTVMLAPDGTPLLYSDWVKMAITEKD